MEQSINLHVSVDCVLIGFDGEQFRVLLVKQVNDSLEDARNVMKLPGSLIYNDEDLDEAAKRVLHELTGLKNVKMIQFKAYGSKNRTHNPEDLMWLERFHSLDGKKVDRIVTIAYLSFLKIDRRVEKLSDKYNAKWMPVSEVKKLAFDHLQIMHDALVKIRHYVEAFPVLIFDLLPRKFTAAQLRSLYQLVYDREFDVRNFHKKIVQMPYVVMLEEKEVGVSHRAARYYKFDRVAYNKIYR
ncbi:MAG: NUDIX hydrolase [Bacteroides sp.]|nr:NUDIX hydrolase [Bacteroides sp.]